MRPFAGNTLEHSAGPADWTHLFFARQTYWWKLQEFFLLGTAATPASELTTNFTAFPAGNGYRRIEVLTPFKRSHSKLQSCGHKGTGEKGYFNVCVVLLHVHMLCTSAAWVQSGPLQIIQLLRPVDCSLHRALAGKEICEEASGRTIRYDIYDMFFFEMHRISCKFQPFSDHF